MKDDFVWGAASASYQIEGAAYKDGKGLSIWDTFCKKQGAIYGGHNGDVACDHYHRYKEDIVIMKEIGIKAYRLSLSWPRILPKGTGEINQKGIAFYNNLIDELLRNDIVPYITLYHWDMPLELYHKGGWMNRDTADYFAEYAKVVAENFSDRVKNFITFNEPQCFIGLGYAMGVHAPGLKMSFSETVLMSHNVLLAHGKAVKAMREYGAKDIKLGYAPAGEFAYPRTETKNDIEAARKATFASVNDTKKWSWSVSWWSDPVMLGEYPVDGLELFEEYLPVTWKDDLEIIYQPLDFMGQNLYFGYEVYEGKNGEPVKVERYNGFPRNSFNWPITPNVMKWAVKFLYERYKLPIYITENGISCHDVISIDGKVHDPNRIDFLNRYLSSLKESINEGIDVRGYFLWSIMDNFEWAEGYNERFGLVYVDFTTQKRIIKDSGHWYNKVIQQNGDNL